MKIKYDIIQNFIIYILSILFVISMTFVYNKIELQEYNNIESQYRIITETNLNVLDSTGNIINSEILNKYYEMEQQATIIYRIEIGIITTVIIGGFILIALDLIRKVVLIESSMSQGLSHLQKLENFETNAKYQEIIALDNNINEAITVISNKDKARDRLYENMIHDFSTPLHIIQGNLELAANGVDIDYSILDAQTKRLSHLVKMNIVKQDYPLELLSAQQIKTYVTLLQTIYTKVNIVTTIDEQIEITTKPENFYRIIDNLVNNAIKHASPKTVEVSLQQDNNQVILKVANDGKPISPKLLESIFERNTSTSSTGIGLDIVKQIIDDLDYKINVSRNADTTVFEITINI